MARRAILCFGDSNTFGTIPMTTFADRGRHDEATRWPGVLAERLGSAFHVIEEGLGGRTTVHDDPIEGANRNGLAYLIPCLESHRPLEAVVIMLGTNDLKPRFSVTPTDIAFSLGVLVDAIGATRVGPNDGTPRILLVAPAPIEEVGELAGLFTGGAAKSRALATAIETVARSHNIGFLDAGAHIRVSPIDGIHFAAEEQVKLGNAIAAALGQILA